jgi:undecaprenyl-phosphate galactose phosphotransferase
VLDSDPRAAAAWAADQKLPNDPRITKIGRFLRRSSLDELPQLFNVLRGEMSLVGPRPIVAAEVARYESDIEYYYEAKPGITGLWQVSGRNDTGYARRVKLDVWYVRNWTLWHDIAILLKTIPAVFLRRGAH